MPIAPEPVLSQFPVKPTNFIPGRGPCAAPVAVVLHGGQFALGEIDAFACRNHQSVRAHQSFHYAVDGNSIHSYVGLDDTAIAFYTTELNPTGLTPCPGGTLDQSTVNILVNWPKVVSLDDCPENFFPDCTALCHLLAHVFTTLNIVPSLSTLYVAVGELPGLDLVELLACVNEVIDNLTDPPAGPLTCDDLADCPAIVSINTQITNITNTLAAVRDCNGDAVDLATQPIATCDDLNDVLGALVKCDGSAFDPATDRIVTCADLIPVTDDQVLTGSTGVVSIVATPAAPTGPDGQVNYLLSATLDIPAVLSALVKCDDTPFDVAADKVATCADLPQFVDCNGNALAPQSGAASSLYSTLSKLDPSAYAAAGAPWDSAVLVADVTAGTHNGWFVYEFCVTGTPPAQDPNLHPVVAGPYTANPNIVASDVVTLTGNTRPTCGVAGTAPVYQVATCDDLAAIDVCALLAVRPDGADVLVSPIPTAIKVLGDDCEFHSLVVPPAPIYTACDGAPLETTDLVLTANKIDPAGAVSADRVLVDTGACPTYLRAPACDDTLPSIPVVFGADANGNMAFGVPWRAKLRVFTQLLPIEDHLNGNDVRVYRGTAAGTVRLTEPEDCRKNDVYIKNRSGFPLTVVAQAGATIDGQASIVLDPVVPGGYPFGNDGGESVHLVWDAAASEWLVL